MSSIDSFGEWFHRATGQAPYEYQAALADSHAPPSILNVPTGCGKTQALIGSWLYRRLQGQGPRRLVYALPVRALVEQTAVVARKMRDNLQLNEDKLGIHVLMGGVDGKQLRDWRAWPERDQILIGTIDMLLSRALNRGFAESRFAWPLVFGLLNNDCRWIFDEVQLMGPARATSAQLDGLRQKLGVGVACETIWASATVDQRALVSVDRPDLGAVMHLGAADRGGALHRRLNALKLLRRDDVSDIAGSLDDLPKLIAARAVDAHQPGTRTLVVLNRVELAQKTYLALAKEHGCPDRTVLLHSRFRPQDRIRHLQSALADPTGDAGTIIVATQVVEAGIDLSARTLITQSAPMASIVQRCGRCNRDGSEDGAQVIWLDEGPLGQDAAAEKSAAPYSAAAIELARLQLLNRMDASLSPTALESLDDMLDPYDGQTLRRRDLLDLFDTSPDLSGLDLDIEPFIREEDSRTVSVFFRNLPNDASASVAAEPRPDHSELVRVPRSSIRKERECWIEDFANGGWIKRNSQQAPPGAVVLLRAADGGYDPELGWYRAGKKPVESVPVIEGAATEATAGDPLAETGEPEHLAAHLERATQEAEQLLDALGLEQWREVILNAVALHDIGKAHPVVQAAMRKAIGDSEVEEDSQALWAKSGRSGRLSYARRYFRHELPAAIAVFDGLDGLQLSQRELVSYLIACHHGKLSMSIRPGLDEQPPDRLNSGVRFALGVWDGDALPAVQTPLGQTSAFEVNLELMEIGAKHSWASQMVRLREGEDLGPFRLAYLSAIVRIADWRASGA